jgi:hypothetical protein
MEKPVHKSQWWRKYWKPYKHYTSMVYYPYYYPYYNKPYFENIYIAPHAIIYDPFTANDTIENFGNDSNVIIIVMLIILSFFYYSYF